jgi:predicted PurR-regulated permease PerM
MAFSKLKTYSDLVMFSHTLFSLPFAMIAMLWAANGLPHISTVIWIVIAFIGARNGANALNRLIDRDIDAKNPRTAGRHLPSGIIKHYEVLLLAGFCFGLLILAAYMLNPLVDFMVLKGMNKRIAVILSLIVVIGFTALVILYILPCIVGDILELLQNINSYKSILKDYADKIAYDSLPPYFKSAIDGSISRVQFVVTDYLNRFFNQIIDFSMELPTYILTPIFIYYFLIDKNYLINIIKTFVPIKIRSKTIELGNEVDKVIGSFLKSQIILSLIIFILTFVALLILKIRYPLIIAFINGIANIIPYFGPVIGFVPAFLAAAAQSMNKAIIVAVVFFAIQQIESGIIAPKLMGESLGMHPVFIMIILLLGGKFFGGWGLILSIPVAGAIKVT